MDSGGLVWLVALLVIRPNALGQKSQKPWRDVLSSEGLRSMEESRWRHQLFWALGGIKGALPASDGLQPQTVFSALSSQPPTPRYTNSRQLT